MLTVNKAKAVPIPLFRDPKYDGAADPMIIKNDDNELWMFYTARRATLEGVSMEWCFGTQIGVAVSKDFGVTFEYIGELNLNFEDGLNTFWAPDIIKTNGKYHMFVSYSKGVSVKWRDDYRMAHYTSNDLWNWHFEQLLDIAPGTIDASVKEISPGYYRMWYRRCNKNACGMYYAESNDLVAWDERGIAINDRCNEGPNVFFWKNSYWMITDTWKGQDIYRSDDALNWQYHKRVLDKPGKYESDKNYGHHASVIVFGERAYIVYFTHNIDIRSAEAEKHNYSYDVRRSYIHIAELEYKNGEIYCNRDKEVRIETD